MCAPSRACLLRVGVAAIFGTAVLVWPGLTTMGLVTLFGLTFFVNGVRHTGGYGVASLLQAVARAALLHPAAG